MKKSVFLASVAVLVFGIASESWADKCISDGSTTTGGTWENAGTSCLSCGINCNWELNNGKLTVSTKDNATNVYINNNRNNGWYSAILTEKFNSVEIENGIRFIGSQAFHSARKVTSITIPNSVTYIGEEAFHNTGITSIDIPDSVTSIGKGAFSDSNKLTSVNFGPDSQLTSIRDSAFYYASSLTSITIPDSVTSIGISAFNGATSLTSITIPDSVTSIGNFAFNGTTRLKEIIIPDSWADSNPSLDVAVFSNVTANIVCEGDTAKCQKALEKFLKSSNNDPCPEGLTCNCNAHCISPSRIKAAKNSSQCTGVGYIWDTTGDGACRRKTVNECNEYDNYYYTGGRCQILPNTKTNCEGAEFVWVNNKCSKINKSYCTNKGQVFWDNKCMDEYPFSRKHWTPAEANEYLYDDNNTITITFKK